MRRAVHIPIAGATLEDTQTLNMDTKHAPENTNSMLADLGPPQARTLRSSVKWPNYKRPLPGNLHECADLGC